MRQHIDTAPIWEVYKQDCECPLCKLAAKVEQSNVDYFLGESVMEPDQRIEVNQKGFCADHFRKLHAAGNHLGLGLMTHTYLKETIRGLKKDFAQIAESAGSEAQKPVYKRLGSKKGADLQDSLQIIDKYTRSCVLCERVAQNMERYSYTIVYMYKHEAEFPALFQQSKGVCLKHLYELLDVASKNLTGETLKSFVETLLRLEEENLDRMEKEIEWFTLKFDYKNDDKPWGNSRDAVKRTINKLRGECIDK